MLVPPTAQALPPHGARLPLTPGAASEGLGLEGSATASIWLGLGTPLPWSALPPGSSLPLTGGSSEEELGVLSSATAQVLGLRAKPVTCQERRQPQLLFVVKRL